MGADRVDAYLRELPRLLAEQSVRWTDAVAFGSGTMDKASRQRVERRWKEQMKGPGDEPEPNRLDVKADRHKLAGFGIGVHNGRE